MTTKSKQDTAHAISIRREIRELEATEFLVETNQGTYGCAEACRAVGSGSPEFADRNVYETVAGQRRETGPAKNDAPGRMRRLNNDHLQAARKRVVSLRSQLRGLESL